MIASPFANLSADRPASASLSPGAATTPLPSEETGFAAILGVSALRALAGLPMSNAPDVAHGIGADGAADLATGDMSTDNSEPAGQEVSAEMAACSALMLAWLGIGEVQVPDQTVQAEYNLCELPAPVCASSSEVQPGMVNGKELPPSLPPGFADGAGVSKGPDSKRPLTDVQQPLVELAQSRGVATVPGRAEAAPATPRATPGGPDGSRVGAGYAALVESVQVLARATDGAHTGGREKAGAQLPTAVPETAACASSSMPRASAPAPQEGAVRSATERTSPLTSWAQSVPSSAAPSQGEEQSPVSGARTVVKDHEVGLARAPGRAAADGVSVLVRDVVPAAINPSANAPQPASAPSAGAGGAAASQVPIAMDRPDWDASLGERVVWLVGKDLRQAELHLDPPELGRIKVHINLAGDRANVSFTARHEGVRDALESALPRLRDMLSDQGWNAVNVSVSQQSAHHGRHHSGSAAPDYPVTPVDGDPDEEAWSRTVPPPAASLRQGGVDDYV